MKLELKELAPYLPYGLKVLLVNHKSLDGKEHIFNMSSINVDVIEGTIRKPILRPLSDLTKEIDLGDGSPIMILSYLELDFEDLQVMLKNDVLLLNISWHDIEILFQAHFDVFGLIPKGLAIDINTLKQD